MINELRIGNWVTFLPTNKPLMFKSFQGLVNTEISTEKFDPIPLSPEILEKCGFEKRENGYWLEDSYYFDGKDLYYFGYECPNESYADKLRPYLHWLQNHYYFTKGKELNIDL